jgi:hypothetical protein
MRYLLVISFAVSLAACDPGGRSEAGASLLSESGGEVALADGNSFDFRITSEKYKQWDAAQRGISKRIAARFGAILRPDAPTERSIASAVTYLEGQPSARQAIESAGMSVRDFVVMTVALEQEMRLASRETREPAPASEPYEFPPVDTTFVAPQPLPQPAPVDTAIASDTVLSRTGMRVDSTLPVDTAFGRPRVRFDSVPRRRPAPAATIFRRDTAPPRRDSSPPRPVTRDTVRDTTRPPAPVPPDTLPT